MKRNIHCIKNEDYTNDTNDINHMKYIMDKNWFKKNTNEKKHTTIRFENSNGFDSIKLNTIHNSSDENRFKDGSNFFSIKYVFDIKNEHYILNPMDMSADLELDETQSFEYSSLVTINHSLYKYLSNEKDKIHTNESQWDILKKQTNPYEYVYSNLNSAKLNVCTIKPISRAFFKFVEIYTEFNYIEEFKHKSIQSFHCAEGPGGFIEALSYLRRKNTNTLHTKHDSYIGMTLQDNENDLPNWNRLDELKHNETIDNFKIENGITGDGNLLQLENFEYIHRTYGNTMDLVTGDAGFDFSNKYKNQEYSMLKLLISQFCYALILQNEGGSFILKVFDLFMKPSIQLLYLMNCFYDTVSIIKPKTSRIANSEKYIVCKNFTFNSRQMEYYKKNIYLLFQQVLVMSDTCILKSIFKNEISYSFLKKIETINYCIGQKQLLNIHETNELIQEQKKKKNRFDIVHLKFSYNDKNMDKHLMNSLEWCKYYDLPYKCISKHENIFITQ